MCGGFFELFLAKDFGASCAEVGNETRTHHRWWAGCGCDYYCGLLGGGLDRGMEELL